MKKNILLACGLVFCVGVKAQSSVTLYGAIDTALIYTVNQQTIGSDGKPGSGAAVQMGYVGQGPSKFGLTGSEDLGGGKSAIFKLENYFFPGSGQLLQPNTLFNSAAYVGLAAKGVGTVSIGRQTDSSSDALAPFASSNLWATSYGSHFGDIDNLNQAFTLNNSLKFSSDDWNGIKIAGSYSFGGVSGSFTENSGYSAGISYSGGPFSFGMGYLAVRSPLQSSLGGESAYIGDASCTNPTALYCELQNAESIHVLGVGGSFTSGSITVGGTYTHTMLKNSRFSAPGEETGANVTLDIVEGNVLYMLAPDLGLGAAYIFNDVRPSGTSATRLHQINLGVTYSLSKRTAIYLVGIGQISTGHGLGTSAEGEPANYAQIPILGNSASNRQATLIGGLRTSF